jgi:hypothetical protein
LGLGLIVKFYTKNKKGGYDSMNCVVVDLDGTLANCDHRLHLIEGAKKNWDLFFDGCINDTVIEPMLNLIRLLSKDNKIVFITARPEKNRTLTAQWLVDNNITYDLLMMRPNKDFNKSPVSKQKMLSSLIDSGYNPIYAFDDRADCVQMFIQNGIYAFLVGENEGKISY